MNGQPVRQIRNEAFGGVIHNKEEVEERIRRAQRAILNPSTALRDFLDGHDEDPPERELSFSKNCVCLEISGPDVADLSFVDLPGESNVFTIIFNCSRRSERSDCKCG